jgi:hypothetical protein
VLPRFEELVASYGGAVPENVAGRELLQRATRESMSERGADVAGLTDNQMSDYQFWLMFPNVYMQLRAGEATVIWFRPDPSGDPNRCFWQVTNLQWFPEGQREGKREPLRIVPEGEHFPYFLALEQDYRQLENQQLGLRNRALKSMHLTRQEPKVAHLHAGVDAWLEGRA